jgi:hypothetical protein
VFQQTISLTVSAMLLLTMSLATAQLPADWQKRYGPPAAERYIIRDGFLMTAFYSKDRQTCKVVIEAAKLQSSSVFNDIVDEVVPFSDRGREGRSIGLSTGGGAGLAVKEYERVSISLITATDGSAKGVQSAIVQWKGTQCVLADQK